MFTVALIGGDGAGKTTIAKNLARSLPFPVRYLYMGLSTRSSNMVLPTSRLNLFLKKRSYKKATDKSVEVPYERIPASYFEYSGKESSSLWHAARLLNRLAEAWYRQFISISYRFRGYAVVYDRHFLFGAATEVLISTPNQKSRRLRRLFYWLVRNLYPKPDLVIFLDAPADVLFARKNEASVEYLDKQRNIFLEVGKNLEYFVRVDATQSFDQVLADVISTIQDFQKSRVRGEAKVNKKIDQLT